MNRLFQPEPTTLKSSRVTLCPMQMSHAEELFRTGSVESIWRYMPIPMPRHIDDTQTMIEEALNAQADGTQIPFTVIHNREGQIIGSTRYLDIQPENRSLEIGWTWLTPAFQRTAVNTHCKYLLLEHAFEALGAVRVQFKTDARNLPSQNALLRIGARQEGVLRKHRRVWDGVFRDSVYFSIIDSEWDEIKQRLHPWLD